MQQRAIDGPRDRQDKDAMVLTAALRAFPLIFHAAARRLLVKTLLHNGRFYSRRFLNIQ